MDVVYSTVHRVAFWVLLAVVASTVIRLILLLDTNKRVYNHTPGPCRVISDENGSAGMHFVPQISTVFTTYGYARAFGADVPSGVGSFVLKKVEGQQELQTYYKLERVPINWNGFHKEKFAPLGLSAYENKGKVQLYVVNGHPEAQCVHFFSAMKSGLTHRKALCDPRFSSIRDVAAVSGDRFFIANLGYFGHGVLQTVEFALQNNFGSLYFYDGHNVTVAASGLPTPSAVAFDEKKQLLYVASFLNEFVRVFELSRDNSLKSKMDISLLSSPVGLHIDHTNGELWAACHPVLFQLFIHYQNPTDRGIKSPSQVLRIRIQEDGASWVVTEPYANDGATISGSNSVTYFADQMLIGSLFDRLLHCDVLNPQIT